MCKRVDCPNDGKPTWWGCGHHIEMALKGVPEEERCTCEHVPVEGRSGVWEVRLKEGDADSGGRAEA